MNRCGLRSLSTVTSLVCISLAGCSPPLVVETPTVEQVEEVATCKVAKDPLNPLIVEWPGTSKVALDSTSKHGFVIVSYAGCTLKVLQGCSARGRYGFTGVTPARDSLRIATESDLYARLPLGAASLKGELGTGSALDLQYVAVGERRAEGRPGELEGDCEGATHYVERMTLGAYALDAIASGSVSGGIDVQGAGVGGSRSEQLRRIRGSGELAKCGDHAPSDEGTALTSGCGAILQIGLAPLRTAASAKPRPEPAAADGPEAGPMPGTPTVGPRPPDPRVSAGRDADGDGINDGADACPDLPEDKDGYEDNDGCPDPDNDRDGITDAADKCPNAPEVMNGRQDDDGCPD